MIKIRSSWLRRKVEERSSRKECQQKCAMRVRSTGKAPGKKGKGKQRKTKTENLKEDNQQEDRSSRNKRQCRECLVTGKEGQVQQIYEEDDWEIKNPTGGRLQEEAVRKQSDKGTNITVERNSLAVGRNEKNAKVGVIKKNQRKGRKKE